MSSTFALGKLISWLPVRIMKGKFLSFLWNVFLMPACPHCVTETTKVLDLGGETLPCCTFYTFCTFCTKRQIWKFMQHEQWPVRVLLYLKKRLLDGKMVSWWRKGEIMINCSLMLLQTPLRPRQVLRPYALNIPTYQVFRNHYFWKKFIDPDFWIIFIWHS